MSNSNEEQVLYKCSYCHWAFNSFCINYEEHECFKDFNNETEVIIADENNSLSIVARENTNETQELDLIWAPNTKPSVQDNEATEMLIALRSSENLKKRFDDKRNVKLSLWKEIANVIENNGYKLGPNGGIRCRAKFSNLQHRYTQYLQHMKGSGNANLQKPPFFNEMHELIGSKAKAIPKFTIDSEESTSSNEVESLPGTSNETAEGNANTLKRKFDHNHVTGSTTKRAKNNNDRIIQTIIKCHHEDKEERNNQFTVLKSLLEKQVEQRDRLLDILQNLN